MLGQVAAFGIIAIVIFAAILFLVVESWKVRIILAAIVAAVWYFFGFLGTMIVAAVLSIGVLIGKQIPTISKI